MIRIAGFAAASALLLAGTAYATTVYPIDRAEILSGARFDFKVEFDAPLTSKDVKVTINGQDAAKILGKAPQFLEKDAEVNASAVLLRDVALKAGKYKVEASDGKTTKTVNWTVYGVPEKPVAKNVILMIGDGMSMAHRTAARLLSKGMTEGKANGMLAMDTMPNQGLIGTSSVDSIAADSANTASAYLTGHKSSVNALGVYADRTRSSLDDPKQETIAEILRRTTKKAVGIVSDAELQDATPASVVAHTRRRADKQEIADMLFGVKPEVLLGGGSAYFLPKSNAASKRTDETDLVAKFTQAGFKLATTQDELMKAQKDVQIAKLFGIFHPGNMDGVLDRKFLKKGTVDKYPNQPDLTEMTEAALNVLARNQEGFFLMVESAMIDKYSHPLDWERSVYDTIMFDKSVALARAFVRKNPDTLLIVTSDHTHGISLIGTVDDAKPGTEMREKVGVYDQAGFPNYADKDGDGYPDNVEVSKRLAVFISNFPDHYETYRPKLDGPFVPAVQNDRRQYVANEKFKAAPGAQFREGNLPRSADTGVHAVDDVVIFAEGPGAAKVRGYMENTKVFRIIAEALALGRPVTTAEKR
jgi:alkaline phosphatase